MVRARAPRSKGKARIVRRRRAKRPARRGYQTINNVGRSLNPIPQRTIVSMKYAEDVTTNGGTGDYVFNLNSIFDPNRSGLGHQPYGHDTFQTLYNRYRVISCKWKIQCLNTSGFQMGAIPLNEVFSFSTLAEMRENPRSRFVVQNAGGATQYLSGKTYIPSLVGRTKAQYMADDRYQAAMGTSPQELASLLIMLAGPNGATLPSVPINVLLEYTVEFFDIKHLAQS